jgi:hypothetical protein
MFWFSHVFIFLDENNKHTDFYAPVCFAFFAFVVSCFSSFGPNAVQCRFSLADLELRQHDSLLAVSLLCLFHLPVLSFALFFIARSHLASVTLSSRLLSS